MKSARGIPSPIDPGRWGGQEGKLGCLVSRVGSCYLALSRRDRASMGRLPWRGGCFWSTFRLLPSLKAVLASGASFFCVSAFFSSMRLRLVTRRTWCPKRKSAGNLEIAHLAGMHTVLLGGFSCMSLHAAQLLPLPGPLSAAAKPLGPSLPGPEDADAHTPAARSRAWSQPATVGHDVARGLWHCCP